MDTMNDRYNLHKEKLEMFSSAEIMEALNEFFSNPNWRDEKRFVITSKFGVTRDYGIGFKRADMAADWAIDSAIRYLREEFGIFYAPDTVDKDDEYRKQDIKCTNECYISYLESRVEQINNDLKSMREDSSKLVNEKQTLYEAVIYNAEFFKELCDIFEMTPFTRYPEMLEKVKALKEDLAREQKWNSRLKELINEMNEED